MGVTFASEAAPRDRFVDAHGLRFHYLEWGEAESPPIVLLHGFAQTCHSWDFVALSLCDRFRVVALDQRGHGDSDWAPDGDYTPEAYQSDLHAIVQELGLREIVLIGLSMGGRNAFTYASSHPERVRALVIVDAAPESRPAGTENIRRFGPTGRRARLRRRLREEGPGIQPPEVGPADPREHTQQSEAAAQRQVDLEVRQAAQVARTATGGRSGNRTPPLGLRRGPANARPWSYAGPRPTS